MRRVRERLQAETARIEAGEERRKAREAKKFAKQVQAEREKEKAQARKAQVKSVEQWRKQRKRNNYGGSGEDLPAGLENELEGRRGRGKESKQQAGLRFTGGGVQKSKKRQARDQKFGFGGTKKKLAKQNDAKSADDLSGFKQGKFAFRHGAKKKGGAAGGNRPGKARRAAARNKQ